VLPFQAKFSVNAFGPDHELRLHHAEKSRPSLRFNPRPYARQRVARIKVPNRTRVFDWDPLRGILRARSLPLFDGEKSMWHGADFIHRPGASSTDSSTLAEEVGCQLYFGVVFSIGGHSTRENATCR